MTRLHIYNFHVSFGNIRIITMLSGGNNCCEDTIGWQKRRVGVGGFLLHLGKTGNRMSFEGTPWKAQCASGRENEKYKDLEDGSCFRTMPSW
jgi:hypothetical protein